MKSFGIAFSVLAKLTLCLSTPLTSKTKVPEYPLKKASSGYPEPAPIASFIVPFIIRADGKTPLDRDWETQCNS